MRAWHKLTMKHVNEDVYVYVQFLDQSNSTKLVNEKITGELPSTQSPNTRVEASPFNQSISPVVPQTLKNSKLGGSNAVLDKHRLGLAIDEKPNDQVLSDATDCNVDQRQLSDSSKEARPYKIRFVRSTQNSRQQ